MLVGTEVGTSGAEVEKTTVGCEAWVAVGKGVAVRRTVAVGTGFLSAHVQPAVAKMSASSTAATV